MSKEIHGYIAVVASGYTGEWNLRLWAATRWDKELMNNPFSDKTGGERERAVWFVCEHVDEAYISFVANTNDMLDISYLLQGRQRPKINAAAIQVNHVEENEEASRPVMKSTSLEGVSFTPVHLSEASFVCGIRFGSANMIGNSRQFVIVGNTIALATGCFLETSNAKKYYVPSSAFHALSTVRVLEQTQMSKWGNIKVLSITPYQAPAIRNCIVGSEQCKQLNDEHFSVAWSCKIGVTLMNLHTETLTNHKFWNGLFLAPEVHEGNNIMSRCGALSSQPCLVVRVRDTYLCWRNAFIGANRNVEQKCESDLDILFLHLMPLQASTQSCTCLSRTMIAYKICDMKNFKKKWSSTTKVNKAEMF